MHLIPEKNVALLIPFFPLPDDPRVPGPVTAPHTWLPRQSIQETSMAAKIININHVSRV